MRQPRKNRLTDLGELQLQVLDKLIASGSATVQTIADQFDEAHRPRYTTILTVLRTLEQKGLATHVMKGRTYHYAPTAQADGVRGSVLREVLDKVFGGSPRHLVATLMDTDVVTPAVLEELKKLIADSEG